MEVRSRFECKKGQSVTQCKSDFLDAHPEFEHVKVLGDGNCFFRSIAAYYERNKHLEIDGVHNPTNHNELRQYVVHRFGQQITNPQDEYEMELRNIYLPALNERSIEKILTELATTCTWNVPVFEMMVERTAPILNINLRLFRMNQEKIDPNKPLHKNNTRLTITESFYHSGTPGSTTISILLIGGHYELLYPTNIKAATAASMTSANVNNFANNELNENMKAAIAASMNSATLEAAAQQYNNQKYAEEFQELQINKPSIPVANNVSYHSNSSIVSNASNVSNVEFNEYNIENIKNQYPYSTTTVVKLKELLDAYNIPYHSKELKPYLYGEFVMAFKANVNRRTSNKLKSKKQDNKYNTKVASRKAARIARRAAKYASKKANKNSNKKINE